MRITNGQILRRVCRLADAGIDVRLGKDANGYRVTTRDQAIDLSPRLAKPAEMWEWLNGFEKGLWISRNGRNT